MKNQKNRYIHLNGDPLRASFLEATLQSPMTKAAGLSAVFNMAVLSSSSAEVMISSLVGSALVYTIGVGIKKGFDCFHDFLFRDNDHRLCIDTKPDFSNARTDLNHIHTSKELMQFGLAWSIPSILLDASIISIGSYLIYKPVSIPLAAANPLSLASTTAACMSAYLGPLAWRFHKVVKEDWIITEPPKEIRQTEKEINNAPLPQATL